jgi:ketosteroid isomerase-like protein
MRQTSELLVGEHLTVRKGDRTMRRIIFASMTLVVALLFVACGDQGAGNKPANAPANNANAAPVQNAAAIETDIKKIMTDAAAALSKNDAAAMEKIYADNYMLVNTDGSVQNKTERIAALKSGDAKYESFSYDEIGVRSNPEGTGAISIATAHIKGTMKGKAIDGAFRVTQVYSKTKDGWKQVSAQATKIEAAAPAKADDKAKTDDKGKDEKSK